MTRRVVTVLVGDPVWEIAGGMIAHETFKATGDTTVLRRGYASLKALVRADSLTARALQDKTSMHWMTPYALQVDFFNRKGNTQSNGIYGKRCDVLSCVTMFFCQESLEAQTQAVHIMFAYGTGLTTFGFEGDWLGVEGCYPQRSRAWSLPNTSLAGCLLSNMSSATAQFVAVSQLADMAGVLGESQDHSHYTSVQEKLRVAYHEAFFDPSTGSYRGNGTHVWQFANLMPLALNITPSESVSTVLSALLASVQSGANGVCASAPCIATGFWGTRFMLQTLTRYGHHALAVELATKTEQPSWGFMVESNRSVGTLWEAWDGGSLVTI